MSIAFKAEIREQVGSLASKKIKRQGLIPAVIYSPNGNINLSLNSRDFEVHYLKGIALTTVIELDINGKKTKVIAHKIDLDPVSDAPIHIDFIPCEKDKAIRVKPKIKFTNQDKCPGIKRGGFLHVVARRVEVICENEQLVPHEIEVDIGSTHVGAKVRAENATLPSGVKFAKKNNFLIASIIGRGKSDDDKSAATTDAPASGAKADDKKAEAKK